VDEFITAPLSAKLAKSNVFIITDEAEKPLLSLGFYLPSNSFISLIINDKSKKWSTFLFFFS
jgi:hypothetical protein